MIGRSDELGRYYTKFGASQLLVREMPHSDHASVLDLGSGKGALALAALNEWERAKVITVDIDPNAQQVISSRLKGYAIDRHRHIRADVLNPRLPQLIQEQVERVEVGVCNPPFAIPRWRPNYSSILEEAGFSSCIPKIRDANCALLFLAQYLRMLPVGGALGIVLPDSLISSTKYQDFRKALVTKNNVIKVLRLPRTSFVGTDAQAHIVVLTAGGSGSTKIKLSNLDSSSSDLVDLTVDADQAIKRLDWSYHRVSAPTRTRYVVDLGSLLTSCNRGAFTSSEVKATTRKIFHTSDLTRTIHPKWRDLSSFTTKCRTMTEVRAQAGDILLARVGRHLEEQAVGVKEGDLLVSDCIYVLRAKTAYRNTILKQLVSERGRDWLASRAYGVSAKQLTKRDLLAFPVFL